MIDIVEYRGAESTGCLTLQLVCGILKLASVRVGLDLARVPWLEWGWDWLKQREMACWRLWPTCRLCHCAPVRTTDCNTDMATYSWSYSVLLSTRDCTGAGFFLFHVAGLGL